MRKIDKEIAFIGPFAEECREYIIMNRQLGYKYKNEETYLKQFDNFAIGKAEPGFSVTKELFEEWTAKRSYESLSTQRIRYDVLAKFCRYRWSLDHDTYIRFHPLKKTSNNGFSPYIFSQDEINRIFEATDQMEPKSYSRNYHLVYPVLFRMLYACGMRLSEALNLKVGDVNLSRGTLAIRNTKFDKSRLIPMSTSLLVVCRGYSEAVHEFSDDYGYYFPSPHGGPYAECTVYTRFRRILFKADISHRGRGKGPRLHDLRHTFAIHSLRKMVQEGQDIYAGLPVLSGYLGHKNIYSTQQYLHLTAEVFPELTEKFEVCFGKVFPEVSYEEV